MSAAANLQPLHEQLGDCEVIVTCGSGGVGKTTVSAALGLAIVAAEERNVLVLTVDPARRLATALGLQGMGPDVVPVPTSRLRAAGLPVRGRLFAGMLDMKSAWDKMVDRYSPDRATAQRILTNRFYQGISDSFVGSHEYMAMEALYELHTGGEYDCVIIDTPPSRNALDFLEAPNRLSDFVGARFLSWLVGPTRFGFRAINFAARPFVSLADRILGGDLLAEVRDFVADFQQLYTGVQQHAHEVYRLLRSAQVGFLLVSSLDPAPVQEARYFAGKLHEYRMPLRAAVANRVLPTRLAETGGAAAATAMVEETDLARWLSKELGTKVAAEPLAAAGRQYLLLHRLARQQQRQLAEMRREIDAPLQQVPLFAEELGDLKALVRIAQLL